VNVTDFAFTRQDPFSNSFLKSLGLLQAPTRNVVLLLLYIVLSDSVVFTALLTSLSLCFRALSGRGIYALRMCIARANTKFKVRLSMTHA